MMMFGLHFTVFVALAIVSIIHQREYCVVEAASCDQDFQRKAAFCSGQGLKSVPIDLLPDLRELYLQDNLLTKLENGTFSMYPRLQVVVLSDNNISHVASGAFTQLEDLMRLSVNSNSFLSTLHNVIFDSIKITTFDANKCNLESFAGGIIKVSGPKAFLHLSGNKLRNINWTNINLLDTVDLKDNKFRQISKDTFVLHNYVDTLDLSGNPIVLIESSAISSLRVKVFRLGNTQIAISQSQLYNLFVGIGLSTAIRKFELSGAKLGTIEPGVFAPLKGRNLDEFNIGSNGLNAIHDDVFSDLTGVSKLVLSSNNLQVVEPAQFNGMTSIRSLVLDTNQIKDINTQAGPWNISLTQLNLADNALVEINSSAFQDLKTLQILNLRENSKLRMIDNDTFANLPFLMELDLTSTYIINLFSIQYLPSLSKLIIRDGFCPSEFIQPGNMGKETPSMSILDLANSRLYSYALWDSVKNLSSFSDLHILLRLDISNNMMHILPDEVFSNLSNLQYLFLGYCSLQGLEVGIFKDLKNLAYLDLSHNYLRALSPGLFDQMNNLQDLSLSSNELTYLDSDVLKYCISLLYLSLDENTLAGLNKSTFEPLSNLNRLYLASNPLVCNCDLKWLPGWLKGSVVLLDSLDTLCLDSSGTLEPFRGKQLITFDPGNLCGPDIILHSCLVMVGVVLILTLCLIYYQRWWIRYRLFLLKLCFIGYEEIQDGADRRDLLYDLAIMLHEVDDEWVNQHLRPALLARVPDFNRIVCGDEELMLGMYYLDAVHYATENSFKTIVIISREALQDQWFIMKFRTLLDHVNDVGTEKMILIFVEDIPSDELPFLIRLFLSDHRPYLVWTDDQRGHEYFWKELVKDLKVNIKCNNLVPPE